MHQFQSFSVPLFISCCAHFWEILFLLSGFEFLIQASHVAVPFWQHVDDLERPLVSEDLILNHSLGSRNGRNISPGESGQPDSVSLAWGQGPAPKQRVPSTSAQLLHSI